MRRAPSGSRRCPDGHPFTLAAAGEGGERRGMAVSKAGRKGREPRKGSGGRRSDNGSSKDGLGNKATVQLLQDGEGPGGLAVEHAARVGNQAAGAVVAQRKSDAMVAEHPVLRLGSKGVAVAQLQEALNAAGAQPKVDADGDFGPRTASAVRNFQKAHGLDADGIVGPKTWDTLSFAPLQLTEEPPAGKDDGFRTIKVMGKETPTEEAKAAFELAGIAFDKGDHATAVQYY
ncbi:MAG TPA: peptidoglycan-binding domain-containing protein, partial [Acidimicrobiales bacterium]|nr:peptidoglycan-binding domain-containing protein [Acidimicrobiales bacterium]